MPPKLCPTTSVWSDDIRRRDTGFPKWGKGRAHTVSMLEGYDNLQGLGVADVREHESVATEQGPISIGRGPIASVTYMPTVGTLRATPYADTRFTAISDRYYR